jgi:hypothetical protein
MYVCLFVSSLLPNRRAESLQRWFLDIIDWIGRYFVHDMLQEQYSFAIMLIDQHGLSGLAKEYGSRDVHCYVFLWQGFFWTISMYLP